MPLSVHRNLLHWGKRAMPLWCALLIIISTFLIFFQISETASNAIKYSGLFLQLFGLVTIGNGISETRKIFGKPSYFEVALNWLSQFISAFKPPKVTHCSANITLPGLKMEASGYGMEVAGENASTDRKFEVLEKNLNTAMERITALEKKTTEKAHETNSNIESIRNQLNSKQEEIKKLLEESSVGGINIEAVGLAWLTVGIIAATIPEKISTFF